MFRKSRKSIAAILRRILLSFVRMYRSSISPWLGSRCRFYPSCSEYALDALQYLPLGQAIKKICWRLLRCGPWARGGVDVIQVVHRKDKERL